MKHSQHSHGEILFHINDNPLQNDKARRENVKKKMVHKLFYRFQYVYSYVNVY